jgi:hypothetical protein
LTDANQFMFCGLTLPAQNVSLAEVIQ